MRDSVGQLWAFPIDPFCEPKPLKTDRRAVNGQDLYRFLPQHAGDDAGQLDDDLDGTSKRPGRKIRPDFGELTQPERESEIRIPLRSCLSTTRH